MGSRLRRREDLPQCSRQLYSKQAFNAQDHEIELELELLRQQLGRQRGLRPLHFVFSNSNQRVRDHDLVGGVRWCRTYLCKLRKSTSYQTPTSYLALADLLIPQGADGNPVPVATVTLAGRSWKLYKGSNGVNQVFSFLPADGKTISSFSGDIVEFVKYLTSNQGLPTSQYLISSGAGTEPTEGSNAKFTTTSYSLVIT